MSKETEPSLQELEASLIAEAADADARGVSLGDVASIGETPGEPADPVKDENEEADTEENTPEIGDENGDEKPSETKPKEDEDGDGESVDKGDTQSAESSQNKTPTAKPLTKAEKEEARKDRSWKKLEEEKSKFLREKAEFEAQKLQAQTAPAPNPGESPEALANAFEKLASEFEDAGDFDKADEARSKAEQLRAKAATPIDNAGPKGGAVQNQNPQFKVAWQANVERAMHDFPEMKDTNSEFGKTVQGLLRAPDMAQFLGSRPDGAYIAAQLTNLKMTASRVPTLLQKITELEGEIKKLKQGMSLPESGASSRAGATKSFESMTLKEQEQYLRSMAEREDASNRPAVY